MDILNLLYSQYQFFLIIFVRSLGFFLVVPVIGELFIPLRIKVSLAFILSLILFPILWEQFKIKTPVFDDIYTYVFILMNQFIIGLVMGLVLNFMMGIYQILGQFISFQMGLSIGEMMDPLRQIPSYVLSQLLGFLGILIFFYLQGHIILIEIFYDSFNKIFLYINMEMSHQESSYQMFDVLFRTFKWMFEYAMRLSMPIIGSIFLIYVGMGILGRLVPQMNIFILGFSLYIIVGTVMMILYMPYLMDSSRFFMKKIIQDVFYIWGK